MLSMLTTFSLAASENPLTHVVDWPIWQWHGWWLLTNHMVMMVLAVFWMRKIIRIDL